MFGVKAKENQPGDLLRVYGSGTYERSGERWTRSRRPDATCRPRPTDPGNAAAAPSSKRYLDRLAGVVDVGPPGIDPQSDAIISEELEQACARSSRRRARAKELLTFASGPADGEYARVVEAILGTAAKRGRKVQVVGVETAGQRRERAAARAAARPTTASCKATSPGWRPPAPVPFARRRAAHALAALGSLYPEPVHLVVSAKSADPQRRRPARQARRPRRAAVGHAASMRSRVLQAHGVMPKEFAEARGDGPQRAVRRCAPASSTPSSPPSARRRARCNGWRPRTRSGWCRSRPARRRAWSASSRASCALTLPANTYPGQTQPVATVAATALLVASTDTPNDEVKALLRSRSRAPTTSAFGTAQGVKISKASGRRGVAIPLHPGAVEYFGATTP